MTTTTRTGRFFQSAIVGWETERRGKAWVITGAHLRCGHFSQYRRVVVARGSPPFSMANPPSKRTSAPCTLHGSEITNRAPIQRVSQEAGVRDAFRRAILEGGWRVRTIEEIVLEAVRASRLHPVTQVSEECYSRLDRLLRQAGLLDSDGDEGERL